jgi:hypothetical protein
MIVTCYNWPLTVRTDRNVLYIFHLYFVRTDLNLVDYFAWFNNSKICFPNKHHRILYISIKIRKFCMTSSQSVEHQRWGPLHFKEMYLQYFKKVTKVVRLKSYIFQWCIYIQNFLILIEMTIACCSWPLIVRNDRNMLLLTFNCKNRMQRAIYISFLFCKN